MNHQIPKQSFSSFAARNWNKVEASTPNCQKESIVRTDRFMAGASSDDNSEEVIKSSFFACFQIMTFLCYFFVTTSSVSPSCYRVLMVFQIF